MGREPTKPSPPPAPFGASTPIIFTGRIGDDADGQSYRDRLEQFGIDTSHLYATAGSRTGSAVIAVNAHGENSIIVSPGANARTTKTDLSALEDLQPDDVVVLTLEVPIDVVTAAAQHASRSGARLVLNLSPVVELPDAIVQQADPVIVNEHEAEELGARYGDVNSVLITRGADGSTWANTTVPARSDITVVDTTGAGDAYAGTLAAALASGVGQEEAMHAATAAAAEVVTRPGAQ